ncbi:MAG TPA: FAD-dependent oxidoreductase [Jiangellaceae bacterium]|jgi:protoporphyrinogen oxidase|nr:FAD-dependent oxidoreductase [Jiangellaceae bacterium]
MNSSYDLVVLGAGPAGLAAALRAARRGLKVTVLERAGRVGGLAGSFDIAGVRVDHGSHRLHPSTPPRVLGDLRGLLGDDLQSRRRNGRLRVAGRWVGFPLRAGELARELPVPLVARIASESATSPLRRARADTYAGVLRAGLGPTLYDELYGPFAQKLWGLPGDRISSVQARRRVSADTAWKIAARIVRGNRGDGQGQTYLYPRRGFGQIVEALAEAASAAGAEIRLEAEVDSVRVVEDEVLVGTQDADQFTAGHVFSTLPLPVLARISRPAPSLADIESASRLRFRAMLLVYLVHRGGRWTRFDAHYVPGLETPITRISEPANYRDSADDPADRSVLCAEIPCSMTDDVWGLDDESLGDLVDEALARTGLPAVNRLHVETRRLGQVYPVYRVGFEQDLAGVDAWARMLRRVVTFGRQGLFAHDNTHHALVMAYDAVDALRDDGRFDRYAWTAARERFDRHVVED